MIDYEQPEFYRFNEDSINLVHFILKAGLNPERILDIGAGCGVIGLELALNLEPQELVLLELQPEFTPYLEKNKTLFLSPETKVSIVTSSIGSWESHKKFDLIVCNPPYYLPGHGKNSDDPKRDLCRSFKQDGWGVLIARISEFLTSSGTAFLVLKNDPLVISICEQEIAKNKLEKLVHIEGPICYVEIFPRD